MKIRADVSGCCFKCCVCGRFVYVEFRYVQFYGRSKVLLIFGSFDDSCGSRFISLACCAGLIELLRKKKSSMCHESFR